MTTQEDPGASDEYRGHFFQIQALLVGDVWIGHYRLMGTSRQREGALQEAAPHKWTPLAAYWATENEAQTNATEAAHAAIDEMFGHRSDTTMG